MEHKLFKSQIKNHGTRVRAPQVQSAALKVINFIFQDIDFFMGTEYDLLCQNSLITKIEKIISEYLEGISLKIKYKMS